LLVVARALESAWTDHRKTKDHRRETEVLVHGQRGKPNVDTINLRNKIKQHDKGNDATSNGISAAKPPPWSMPALFLSGPAVATGIAAINSVGNLAGFVGPLRSDGLRT
jgi:hypothetical protein